MAIIQDFNEIYEPLFHTKARYIDLWGGRGRGGSHTGTDYFLHLITRPKYFRGYFIRQTFHDIRDSLFRDFKDRIADNDTVNEEDFEIQDNPMRILYKPTGNLIISKGVKSEGGRTAKMKSLAGATHVLIEESDEIGEDDFDQMDLSLRTIKADVQIIRIFNPPHKQHWIWRDYILIPEPVPADFKGKPEEFNYFRAQPRTDANLCSIFSTYHENRINLQDSTVEKFESFKFRKAEYYYTVIRGLISEGMRGRIFNNWKPITNAAFNEIDKVSVFGVDFGSATGGIVEAKIERNKLYLRELGYGGYTDKQLGVKFIELGIKHQVIIGDSADPQKLGKLRQGWLKDELSADEFEKYPFLLKGWNIYGVLKPPGSVQFGIDLLKDYEVHVTEDSSNLWKEYREYKWMLDKNKNPTDDPEDANNHLIDPARYVVMSKGRYF